MTCCGAEAGGGDVGADLKKKIARLIPDVPSQMIGEYVADAQRQFASESGTWRYVDHWECVGEKDGVLVVDAGEGVRVARIEDVFIKRCGCDDCEVMLPERNNRHERCGCCPDQWWWEQVPGTLVFNREWHTDYELRLALVLAPTADSDAFPPALLAAHQDVIKAGALAQLYVLAANEQVNPSAYLQLAGYNEAKFEQGIAEAERAELRDMKPGRPVRGLSRYRGGAVG